MSFPESVFRHPYDFSDESKASRELSRQIDEGYPHQQNSLPETSFFPEADRLIPTLRPQVSALLGLITEGEAPASTDDFQAVKAARREIYEVTGSIPPLAGGRETKRVIGRGDFSWRRDLSENGQKLWKWLIVDMGDKDFLPIHATEEKWDLEAALHELRNHGMLDESDPKIVRVIRR